MSAEGAGGEVNVGVVGSEKEGGSVCKCGGLKCIRADNLFSPSAPLLHSDHTPILPIPLSPHPHTHTLSLCTGGE